MNPLQYAQKAIIINEFSGSEFQQVLSFMSPIVV